MVLNGRELAEKIISEASKELIELKNKNIYPAGRIMQMNKMIMDYATTKGYEYVDYYSAMVTSNGGIDIKYSHDFIHPNRKGYEVMMPIVKKSIDKVLKK